MMAAVLHLEWKLTQVHLTEAFRLQFFMKDL